MDRAVTSRRIKDADDLLEMLERLFDGFSANGQLDPRVPWNGIALTISNCRTLLADSVQESQAMHASSWMAPQNNNPSNSAPRARASTPENHRAAAAPLPTEADFLRAPDEDAPSLASRIRKAPTMGGTVRELGGGGV